MLVFGEKIHSSFFKYIFNIQRCSRFASLEKQKDSTCIQREISLELPFGVELILTEKQKLLWIHIYHLIGKHESLCPLIYIYKIYVHSWQQPEEDTVWMSVMAWAWSALRRATSPTNDLSTSSRCPTRLLVDLDQQSTGASFQVLLGSSMLRPHLELWLISCLGFVITGVS